MKKLLIAVSALMLLGAASASNAGAISVTASYTPGPGPNQATAHVTSAGAYVQSISVVSSDQLYIFHEPTDQHYVASSPNCTQFIHGRQEPGNDRPMLTMSCEASDGNVNPPPPVILPTTTDLTFNTLSPLHDDGMVQKLYGESFGIHVLAYVTGDDFSLMPGGGYSCPPGGDFYCRASANVDIPLVGAPYPPHKKHKKKKHRKHHHHHP